MADVHHSINFVSKRTGLSPHVIRMWERRYNAVEPDRTGTQRRLYTDQDIERLYALRLLTLEGHRISQIANLPMDDLKRLVADLQVSRAVSQQGAPSSESRPLNQAVEDALSAIERLDSHALEQALSQALVRFGHQGMLRQIVGPMAQRIGELWRDGRITAAHEHFASAGIRDFLTRNARPFATTESSPSLIVATPAGQLHEIGAVMVAAAAVNLGWRVTYLGTSLPAAEIAGAAIQNRARGVALSLVYPEDDPHLPDQLYALRRLLPKDIEIIVGGRAANSYKHTLESIRAIPADDLGDLATLLDRIRNPRKEL